MDTPLKVRRKRRGLSLYNKIFEYGELFDMNITIIAQERASGDYEVFQPVRNDNWPPAMRDIIIKDNPIGNGLDAFRASFVSVCEGADASRAPDAIDRLSHEAAGLLHSKTGRGTLRANLLKLIAAITSDDFDFDRIKPLLRLTVADEPDGALWKQVDDALRNTSSFANSSKHRKYVDDILKEELGPLYIGLPNFHDTYFGDVTDFETASKAFFEQCRQGSEPDFEAGWAGWPKDANQDDVLNWFAGFNEKPRLLAKPNKPIDGSIGTRKMDIRFVRGRHSKESRGIASDQFDINTDRLQFMYTILGFLWISEEELGFDPTIITENTERFIEINRHSSIERIIINEVMQRTRYIAGRATTYWKAHLKGRPEVLLIIKDSWQYPERNKEGDIVREVTSKGVVNVARYYSHETVQIRRMNDDIRSNTRRRLDITRATNYRLDPIVQPNWRGSDPSKRSYSASPTKADKKALPNRIYRRVILCDYGKPIYTASTRSALLLAPEGCIKGHESLRKAGFLHRDVSGVSGLKGKTGTRAFIAIGALLDEQYSFMHDLESFFWVLFWICVHYNGPDVNRLRKVVFPNGRRWEREDTGLYSQIRKIIAEARKDPKVLAEGS
ncbi:hypothetical protein EV126DRAFT_457884 [Verticillium dahliae]|nr:hypothetical protein EV126DRAFT_457884 [Verticillium dahliae]